jgi:hypothetical protein
MAESSQSTPKPDEEERGENEEPGELTFDGLHLANKDEGSESGAFEEEYLSEEEAFGDDQAEGAPTDDCETSKEEEKEAYEDESGDA